MTKPKVSYQRAQRVERVEKAILTQLASGKFDTWKDVLASAIFNEIQDCDFRWNMKERLKHNKTSVAHQRLTKGKSYYLPCDHMYRVL